jgi:hypothetical protein
VHLEGLCEWKKIHLIGTRTRDLPVCSIVPQPTTLPRAPHMLLIFKDLSHACSKPSANKLLVIFLPANTSSFRGGHLSTYYTKILITAQQVANWHLFLHYNSIINLMVSQNLHCIYLNLLKVKTSREILTLNQKKQRI